MTKILIAEDDFLFATFLETELNTLNKYHVVKVAKTVSDAINNINQLLPEIAVVDLKLQGQGTGIDLAILLSDYNIPVIFMTNSLEKEVYDSTKLIGQHAYLVKPFHILTLDSAIQNLIMLKDLNKSGGHLIYRDGPVKKMLPFKDIKYLESEGNYSTVFMDNKKFTYKLSLTKMLKDLDPEIFFQIHKKCIVNKNYIISIDFKKKYSGYWKYAIYIG
jgi:two-component system LytT family response regulator